MPKAQYIYRTPSGRVFKEWDILPREVNVDLWGKQQVMEIGDGDAELISTEIIDPFVHQHEWKVRAGPYVWCDHCGAQGVRSSKRPDIVDLEKKWQTDRYEYCREQPVKLAPPRFK